MAIFSGLAADLPTIIANVSLIIVFAGAITAGIFRGIKEFREFLKPAATPEASEKSQIAAVTILENVTLNEWTRSNKEATVATLRLCDMVSEVTDELARVRRSVDDVQHKLKRGAE